MPVDLLPNATDEELVAIVESCQRHLFTGETVFITLPGGGQIQKQIDSKQSARTMLMQALYSCFKRGLSGYDNPYTQQIRVTYPAYT